MPAFECLNCGDSFYSLGRARPRCRLCGGDHFHSYSPGSYGRYPRAFYPGEHASLIYSDDERMLEAVLPYVRAGIENGEEIVGVVDEQLEQLISGCLDQSELDRIELVRPVEAYGSPLDADHALGRYAERLSQNPRLRVFGGFDRETLAGSDIAEIRQLERGAHDLFEGGLTALCIYDARFCPKELLDLAAEHPMLTGREVVYQAA